MKYVFAFMAFVVLAGCSSGPTIVRVKNCRSIGSGLYDCEEIKDLDPFQGK